MNKKNERLSAVSAPDRRALLGVGLVLLILTAVLLANSMTKPVSRDEHMYCTAGVLLARGQAIYRDFAYPSQLPYHPLLLAALYRVSGTSHYLLVGRLVSVFCEILILVSIVGIYRSLFGARRPVGLLLGAAGAVLYVFNPLVDYAAGYAWNHDLVILCVLVSFWILITTDFDRKPSGPRLALIGGLLALATCTRVTTVLVALFFVGVILVRTKGRVQQRMRAVLPFIGAGLVVSSWPIWVAMQAGDAFWLNLMRIPSLYGQWLHQIGIVHSKVALTIAAFTEPGYLVLWGLVGYSVWIAVRRWSVLKREQRMTLVAAALLPALFFLIAYIPPTMWRQYLAIPVPFIIVALAPPLAALHSESDKGKAPHSTRLATIVIGCCVAVTVLSNAPALVRSIAALAPEYWTPVASHRACRELLRDTDASRPVLTLGPLYALEAGCDIYPELASGSIIYRAANLMSTEERALASTVGPEELADLVQARPPAAVILGVEPSYFAFLEEPLEKLIPSGWRRDVSEEGLRFYRAP